MNQTLRFSNVAWLLGSLALVIAPHVPRLPIWISPFCVGIGLWLLYAVRRNKPQPGQRVLLLAAVAAALGVLATYRTLFGRDAGVALLAAMLALKLMEIRALRDVMVAIFLGYFLIITNFLYSQSIFMGLYMLPAALLLTATAVAFNHPGRDAPWQRLRLAAVLLAQAVPLMLVLFVLFPRVSGPLWGLPGDAFAGRTALSDTMSPGSISRLIQSGEVAFRVVFDGPVPTAAQRYWRGPVLDRFDGRTWSASFFSRTGSGTFVALSAPVSYTVTLEPHNKQWLFALDLPGSVPSGARLTRDFQLLSTTPVRQRLRYHITSYPRYEADPELRPLDQRRALYLPPETNPRTRQLAKSWRADGAAGRAVVSKALAMFRNQPFVYTLTPPLLGEEPVDDFLFNTRRGFCEHYAGSFVFLMRAAGIPARVVTGYQGGELNPLGNYMIVRQSDAHAWAEVWLEGEGWVRVDPTAAVSPQRVESGIAGAVPAAALPALSRIDVTWLRQLGLAWDSLNNGWNQWVLGYGVERQMEFLAQLGFGLASWEEMAAGLLAGIGLLLGLLAVIMLWRLKPRPADPAVAEYVRFCAKLSRRGLAPAAGEGPEDFAERAAAQQPAQGRRIRLITKLYVALRYGPHPSPSRLRRLRRAVRTFHP